MSVHPTTLYWPPFAARRHERSAEQSRQWITNLTIAIAAVLPLVFILPLMDQPVSRDEGTYLVMARGLLHGDLPYRDLFDHKPPLAYAWYSASLIVFGDRPAAPRMAGALCLGATVVLCWFCGRRMQGPRGGLVAALAMSGMTSVGVLQWGVNTETFMLPLMTGSLFAWLRGNGEHGRWWLFLSGVLGCLATATKTVAVFNLAALLLAPFLLEREGQRLRSAARSGAWILSGAAIPAALVVLPFVLARATGDLFYANVTYNRLYSSEVPMALRLQALWQSPLTFAAYTAPFTMAAVAGAARACRAWRPNERLLLLWSAASLAGVLSTGHYFLHYYQQLVPAIALLIGSLVSARLSIRGRSAKAACAALGLVISAQFVQANVGEFYLVPVEERMERSEFQPAVGRRIYESRHVGDYLAEQLHPGDTLYNFGRETQLYYYSGAEPAAPDLYDRRLWLDPERFEVTLRALREAPPTYIVDTSNYDGVIIAPPTELADLLASSYRLEASLGFATVYRLRD